MKLTKENVCVFIENEAQLEEARKMLEKYGEEIEDNFDLKAVSKNSHIYFNPIYDEWCHYRGKYCPETQITIQQVEEILKESK
jgi:hypothetical protein